MSFDLSVAPPNPPRRPTRLTAYGDIRIDDYYWMRDRTAPEVIAHLNTENDYTAAIMHDTEALQEQLFQEMRQRIRETDMTAPVEDGGYWYYQRTVAGLNYPIYYTSEQLVIRNNCGFHPGKVRARKEYRGNEAQIDRIRRAGWNDCVGASHRAGGGDCTCKRKGRSCRERNYVDYGKLGLRDVAHSASRRELDPNIAHVWRQCLANCPGEQHSQSQLDLCWSGVVHPQHLSSAGAGAAAPATSTTASLVRAVLHRTIWRHLEWDRTTLWHHCQFADVPERHS